MTGESDVVPHVPLMRNFSRHTTFEIRPSRCPGPLDTKAIGTMLRHDPVLVDYG